MLVVRHTVVGPLQSNGYLAGCSETQEAILIDPGAEVPRLLGMREPGGFRITRIVFTHGHIDHVAGGAEAQRTLGVPIQTHAGDRNWLESLVPQATMLGFERPDAPLAIDHFHQDGEVFQVGRYEGRIIHTPGHTRGSCCVFFAEPKVLFSGDTLFVGSVGRTDLIDGDFAALERSISTRLFTLGDDVRFYPGHGPSGLIGNERMHNPFVGARALRDKSI
jgi:hydroxyacylglutathione hydrolase